MSTIFKAGLLAASVTVWTATAAAASEYRCQKEDSSLRIAVEVKKLGHTLPCEVIAEDDRGQRAVLFKADYDRDYCPSRIERTRGDLEQEGWRCEKTSDENVVAQAVGRPEEPLQQASETVEDPSGSGGELVAGNGNVIVASRKCQSGDEVRWIRIEVEDPERGKPCELLYWPDGDQTKPGELLWRAEHDAGFCPTRLETIVEKWTADGWRCDADGVQTAAIDPAPIDAAAADVAADLEPPSDAPLVEQQDAALPAEAAAADAKLEAVVAADAERIGQWMEVEPAIEIAARGDLNDDGSDDAVVFLGYQSAQSAYRQYLMSYLGADDGYELASVKLLTGVNPPPAQAKVAEIDKGVIWLTLPEADGSASAQTGYKLRDQQLIEVEAGDRAAAD